jgi:hypothetical protein
VLRTLIAAVAALPMLMGCAAFAQVNDTNNMTPEQATLINTTCTNVMGLRKGESYFAECQDSLAHSLARRVAAYGIAAGEDACRHQGLPEGSAALATCTLDNQTGGQIAPPLAPVPISFSTEAIKAGKSYYDVTNDVRFQRERYSCAQLGLMPNSGLFGQCIASLEGALLPDPN